VKSEAYLTGQAQPGPSRGPTTYLCINGRPQTPPKTTTQSDGRIRKWGKIAEAGKYLRVILLEDGETVHNAFFDRSFKEE